MTSAQGSEEWKMDATVETTKSGSSNGQVSNVEDSLNFTLTVSRLVNEAGTYTQFTDNTILQTYLQIVNPEKSTDKYYDNYTSTFKYIASDIGKVKESRYLNDSEGKGASCGALLLGSIVEGRFSDIRGDRVDKCGFYMPNYDAMEVKNSGANGVSFKTAFSRRFIEYGVQEIKQGMSVTMRAGFNIFDDINE